MSGVIRLYVTSNGTPIPGDGPDGALECLGFDFSVSTARQSQTGLVAGRRVYAPVATRRRVDRASPLLLRALTENAAVEARFEFQRPNAPSVADAVFYSVRISEARIVAVRQFLTEPVPGGRTAAAALTEEISFEFGRIRWTHGDGSAEHEDTVAG